MILTLHEHRRDWLAGAVACLALLSTTSQSADAPELRTLRGQVAWFDAQGQRLQPPLKMTARPAQFAFIDRDGRRHAIVPDSRGRGFGLDPRLLPFDYEWLVRPSTDGTKVQIIRTYTWHNGQKFELDYWCDICAIPMFELKECECCQGEIRLRERYVRGETTSSDERSRP